MIHAKTAGAAWSAQHIPDVRLVTDLPDLPRTRMRFASPYRGALAAGHRVIARSLFNAGSMMRRHKIPPERVSVIPLSVDVVAFDPTQVRPQRVAALRQAWGIPSGVLIILTPGRVAPGPPLAEDSGADGAWAGARR